MFSKSQLRHHQVVIQEIEAMIGHAIPKDVRPVRISANDDSWATKKLLSIVAPFAPKL